MKSLAVLLLALLPLAPASAASGDVCAGLTNEADCYLLAVGVLADAEASVAASGTGDATGQFAAASGTGDASTSIWCLEWVCPSVAAAPFGDAHASCAVSSVCVAVSVFGRASHDGIGVSVSACNLAWSLCLSSPDALAGTLP